MPDTNSGPSGSPPPHFIVIVPGYMGSNLRSRKTGRVVWLDFATVPLNPLEWGRWVDDLFADMAYPNDDLEPAGITEEVVFVPPWAKIEEYGRLRLALGEMGYHTDPRLYGEPELNVYSFSYDWRQDNRISGRELGAAISRWSQFHPGARAWIIAHSNGGIVSRWYIEKEGGKEQVGRLFLMASPWDGAPKAMRVLFEGLDVMFRPAFDLFDIKARTRQLTRTFPSAYQLLPYSAPFLRDPADRPIDLFASAGWLDSAEQRQMLAAGRQFNQELGNGLSVETLCFFGRSLPTQTYGIVHLAPGDSWSSIDWGVTEAGDGTVPESSAVNPNAQQKLPFATDHGSIYIQPAVLQFLRWELIDKYRGGERALAATPALRVQFLPDKDDYAPGQAIELQAEVTGAAEQDGGRPAIENAAIEAQLAWRGPLPGDAGPAVPPVPLHSSLAAGPAPGVYRGRLTAPGSAGYYQLSAQVSIPGLEPLSLTELVVVEAAAAAPQGPPPRGRNLSKSYQETAQAYAQGVQALLAAPLPQPGRRAAGGVAGASSLADQAAQLAPVSQQLTELAAAGLTARDANLRETASARLLAKALSDLEISRRLLQAAQAEEGAPVSGATGMADAGRTAETGGAAAATLAPAASDIQANLDLLLSDQPLALRARRAVLQLPSDLPGARQQLGATVDTTMQAIRDQASRIGQEAISGLLVLGLSEIAQAAGIVGLGIAGALGQAEKVSQLYSLFRQFALNAYDSLVALLGPMIVNTAAQQALAWANDVASGKDFGKLVERLYQTAQTEQQIDQLVKSSQAGLEKYIAAIQGVDGLTGKFQAQVGMVGQIIRGLRLLGGVPTAALPQAKLLLAAAYIVIGSYVVLAGADYVDADSLKLLGRFPGVRLTVEQQLS
jgi:Lecithin:cholesterol acyltransferase